MIVLILVFVIVTLLCRYSTKNHDYWAKRNVKHDKPLPFFGNHLPNFLQRRNKTHIGFQLYNKFKGETLVGYYAGTSPDLYIFDPDIMKRIFTTDFEYFPGRGTLGNWDRDPLMHNVIFVTGEEWRGTRQRLTPGFSPGKLRAMYPLLMQCTDQLLATLEELTARHDEIKTYDLMTRYPLQFVGSGGFGVELNTLKAEHSDFVKLAHSIFIKSKLTIFFIVLAELLPTEWFKPKLVKQELEDLIYNMTTRIREERNYKPSGRNDLMDILLKMENDAKLEPSKDGVQIDLDFIAAQLFSLLLGGFETTATSISFTLHQLAFHPEIQESIQREVDEVMSKYDNKLTYEAIGEMALLEMAWKEAMRLFPPFGGISRICEKRYTIPGTNVTIDPGIKVTLPIQALHMDPQYFDNPEEFRPERFAQESKVSKAYIAFGDGPRKCLGMRHAYMMSLTAMAAILHRFSVAPGPSTIYKPEHRNSPILAQNFEGGLPLRFIPRSNKN